MNLPRRAGLAAGVALLLAGTFLTVDRAGYPRSLPGSLSLAEVSLTLWASVAFASTVVTLTLAAANSRASWLAGIVTVLLASPRLGHIESTYLLAAVPTESDERG